MILLWNRLTFYGFQTIHKSVDTSRTEIISLIGLSIKMGILQLPPHKLYWIRELHCPRIAEYLLAIAEYRYLLFVNNHRINTQDKLAKICSLIPMVQDEFVKMETE